MPRVSVLIPCYNAAATLPDTIASLEAQTFADYEIIALDDGSSDETVPLLERWATHNRRVRVHVRPHAGIVAALQAAAELATGAYIVRMDADDMAAPTRIAQQVALLDGDPATAACGTLVRYFPRTAVQGGALRYEAWLNALVESADIARDVFVECPLPHPTLAIRHAAFTDVGGYQERGWPEDYDLVLRLFAAGMRMRKVPEILLHWRERAERHSRVDARYDEAAFRRCKVHYLARTLLRDRDGVIVWGAGPVGKSFALELRAQHVSVRAFVELDPRKLGQTIHGAPVIAPSDIAAFRDAFCVAAVGQPQARQQIRAALSAAGWRDGVDFTAVA